MEMRPNFNGWWPYMEGFPGTINSNGRFFDPYNRKVPDRFIGDSADDERPLVDNFTKNVINKYAIEAINKSGGPIRTHKFYLTKNSAK